MVALTNGCVCCGMSGDLGAGLARLPPAVDHIIIEASGVSDPWALAQLALVETGYSLEPIVVLADASAVVWQLQDRWIADTVRGQLLAAEIIVLNKADHETTEARAAIRGVRSEARLIETRYAEITDDVLRFSVSPSTRFRADTPTAHPFPTWSFVPPGPFDRDRLRTLLSSLPTSVLRVKGFCQLGSEAAPHLLQFASGQWVLTPTDAMDPGLVIIGTPAMPDLLAAFENALR
jgi:G3E family GTPase